MKRVLNINATVSRFKSSGWVEKKIATPTICCKLLVYPFSFFFDSITASDFWITASRARIFEPLSLGLEFLNYVLCKSRILHSLPHFCCPGCCWTFSRSADVAGAVGLSTSTFSDALNAGLPIGKHLNLSSYEVITMCADLVDNWPLLVVLFFSLLHAPCWRTRRNQVETAVLGCILAFSLDSIMSLSR